MKLIIAVLIAGTILFSCTQGPNSEGRAGKTSPETSLDRTVLADKRARSSDV